VHSLIPRLGRRARGRSFSHGKFVPGAPVKGTCIINIADLLQRLSNGRLKCTIHRVVSPPMTKVELEELSPDGPLPGKPRFWPEMVPPSCFMQRNLTAP
jgi:hypothetical protein